MRGRPWGVEGARTPWRVLSFTVKTWLWLPLVSEGARLLPCSWAPSLREAQAGGWEGSDGRPPPPAHWQPRSVTLVSRPLVFVVIYTLVLSPKCQGQCLIHAAPPTPPGAQEDSAHTLRLKRTRFPSRAGIRNVTGVVLFLLPSLLPTVPRMAAPSLPTCHRPSPSSPPNQEADSRPDSTDLFLSRPQFPLLGSGQDGSKADRPGPRSG